MSQDPVAIARRYLEALVSHDAESVPLTADARRFNNGALRVEGADALRAIIRREPVAALHDFRWVVDGRQAIVFYELEADLARGEGPVVSPPEEWMRATIGERFQIAGDAIEEIEVVFATVANAAGRAAGGGWVHSDATAASAAPRATVLSLAREYVDALVTHDASSLALAANARRVENGRETGVDGAAIRAALESEAMRNVQSVDDARWFAGGDSTAAFFTLRTRAGDTDLALRVAERFRVVGGALAEIEAVFAPHAQADA